MNKWPVLKFLWYLAAVPRCAVCGKLLKAEDVLRGYQGSDVLCSVCRSEWEREKLEPCEICGLPSLDCRCMPTALCEAGATTLICLGNYTAETAIGRMILRMKRIRFRRAASFAAAQLAPGIKRELEERNIHPDTVTVTWAPRTKKAKRKFGHDQAELLARALAQSLACACEPLILRSRDGLEQKKLRRADREENVRKVFAANPKYNLTKKNVIAVDDIVSSGTTLGQACRILLDAGAETVLCAAPGRSRLRKNQK